MFELPRRACLLYSLSCSCPAWQAKEKPTEGEVVAAGPGRQHPETAVLMPMPVKPGKAQHARSTPSAYELPSSSSFQTP